MPVVYVIWNHVGPPVTVMFTGLSTLKYEIYVQKHSKYIDFYWKIHEISVRSKDWSDKNP